MKSRSLACLALLGWTLVGSAQAAGVFVDPAAPVFAAALPPPPAPGSLPALADLEAVLQVQGDRTPAEIAWAKRIEKDTLYDYADVLGPWFTAKNLPFTAEFFAAAGRDLQAVSDRTKGLFARPRPPAVDPRVRPCVAVPASFSYPSGHSTRLMARALLLAEIFPERRDELLAWAHRAAWSRIIGGVHFPTDDVGGQLLAETFVAEVLKNPAARAALERARAEAQPFLAAAAAAHPAVLRPAA
jgi:acid phosphatase (class A)